MDGQVWFITGASRGFGAAFVRAALASGARVVAASRRPEGVFGPEGERLLEVALDVTSEAQTTAAVAQAIAKFGRIDVLVNNAGYALFGALEECSDAEVRAQFDTNVFGLLQVTRAVLPGMRARRAGHIINISSTASIEGVAGVSAYCASKFAVDGLTEALTKEVAPLGIKVTLVTPGAFRTEAVAPSSRHVAARRIDDYAATAGASLRVLEKRPGTEPNDPDKLAQALVDFTAMKDPPARFIAGADALARVEPKITRFRQEAERLRDLSNARAFDPG